MSKKVEKPYLLEFLILKPNCDINPQHTTIWHLYIAYRFSSDQLLTSHTLKCWVISSSRFILILKTHFKDHWSLMKNISFCSTKNAYEKIIVKSPFSKLFLKFKTLSYSSQIKESQVYWKNYGMQNQTHCHEVEIQQCPFD